MQGLVTVVRLCHLSPHLLFLLRLLLPCFLCLLTLIIHHCNDAQALSLNNTQRRLAIPHIATEELIQFSFNKLLGNLLAFL